MTRESRQWVGSLLIGLMLPVSMAAAQEVDSGVETTDTGAPPVDTGAPPSDEGPATDTGAPSSTDTGAPPPVESEPVEPEPEPVDDVVPPPVDEEVVEEPDEPPVEASEEPPAPPPTPYEAEPLPEAPEVREGPSPEPVDDLQPYRMPFAVLADRAVGTTSVPVEFDWRRNTAQVGVWGSFLSELNNFNSLRGGAIGRFPTKKLMWEVGISYVGVSDTAATEDLARTPYRQAGRPSRAELDVALGLPLAEGVVTTGPRWFPAVQMVLNGYVDLRYRVYPQGYRGLRLGQVARSIVDPTLSPEELNNLEGIRKDAMDVDSERFGFLMGVGNDFYLKPGIFVSPRVMFSVPVLGALTGSDLLWWSDVQIAVGAAF